MVSLAVHTACVAWALVRSATLAEESAAPPRFFGTSFDIQVVDFAEPDQPAPLALPASASQLTAPVAPPAVAPTEPMPPEFAPPELAPSGPARHELGQSSVVPPAPPRSQPRTSSQASASAETNAPGSAAVFGSSGTFGETGEEQAPSELRRAFIKTLPLAAKLDAEWLSAELGALESVVVEVEVDETGRVQSIVPRSGDSSGPLARAASKNRLFLGRGRYVLHDESGARRLLLRLAGRISQNAPSAEAEPESKVVALGLRVNPSDKTAEPTGAYFTYDNGRHIELLMQAVEK